MDISKIISLIIGIIGGTSPYAKMIVAILEAIGPLLEKDGGGTQPVMDVKWAQSALAKLGFDPGPIDGILGQKTQAAIKAYQTARGLEADGWLGVETQTKLASEVPPT